MEIRFGSCAIGLARVPRLLAHYLVEIGLRTIHNTALLDLPQVPSLYSDRPITNDMSHRSARRSAGPGQSFGGPDIMEFASSQDNSTVPYASFADAFDTLYPQFVQETHETGTHDQTAMRVRQSAMKRRYRRIRMWCFVLSPAEHSRIRALTVATGAHACPAAQEACKSRPRKPLQIGAAKAIMSL